METFNEDPRLFDPHNLFAGDDKVPVEFYMGSVPAPKHESEKAGFPKFVDTECIRIYSSKDNIIDRPLRDQDKQRWPRKYAAWKQSGASEPGGGGWRLEVWPQITKAQVEELKYFKIFTVEQLAEVPDSVIGKIMGAQLLKAKAQTAVKNAKEQAPLQLAQAAIEKRDQEIAFLKTQLAEMGKKMDALMERVAA
jgi:hypothetical protein